MPHVRWWRAVAVATVALSCGGDSGGGTGPTPKDPGFVHLELTTPNADDGILLISIAGGRVLEVEGAGYQVVSAGVSDTMVKVLVRGTLVGGVIGRVTVPDRNLLSSYTITVEQVAARQSYVQRSVEGYAVRIVRP